MKRILKDVIRTLLYLVTAITALVALTLSISRVVAHYPHELERFLNQQLEESGLRFTGLETDWRYTNPTITVEQMEFDQGIAHGIELEVALIESAIRMQLVARRLIVDHVDFLVDLEQNRQDFDVLKLINEVRVIFENAKHTDELRIAAEVFLKRGQDSQNWLIQLDAVNQEGSHRYRGSIASPDGDRGNLRFSADAQEAFFDFQTESAVMTLEADNLNIAIDLLTGQPHSPLVILNGLARWSHANKQVQGSLELHLNSSDSHQFGMELDGEFRKESADPMFVNLKSPKLLLNDSVVVLNDWLLSMDEQSIAGKTRIDSIQEIVPFALELLKQNQSNRDMLEALAPSGSLPTFEFEFDADGFKWYADTKVLHLNSHLNVPEISLAHSTFSGNLNQYLLEVQSAPTFLYLPNIFSRPWEIAGTSGIVVMQVLDSNFSFHSPDLVFNNIRSLATPRDRTLQPPIPLPNGEPRNVTVRDFIREATHIHAKGGLTRAIGGAPDFQASIRLNSVDSLIPTAQISDVLPTVLEEKVLHWTNEHVRSGSIFKIDFLMLQHIDELITKTERRIFLNGRFVDGEVEYLEDWPLIKNAEGQFNASSERIQFTLDKAIVHGTDVAKGAARFPFHESAFDVFVTTVANTVDLLEFVHATDIREWLPMIKPVWEGSGLMTVDAHLRFLYDELADGSASNIPRHTIAFTLHDTSLNLADVNIELNDLNGTVTWVSPHSLNGKLSSGLFFDQPMNAEITSDVSNEQDVVDISFQSRVDVETAEYIASLDSINLGTGTTDFDATLLVYPDSDEPSVLTATTDMEGVAIDMPRPLYKEFDSTNPLTLKVRMFPGRNAVSLQSESANAMLWLDEETGSIEGGTVAIGEEARLGQTKLGELHLTGQLGFWEYSFEDTEGWTLPIIFDEFNIEQLSIADELLNNALLNGTYENEDNYSISVSSNEFVGTISKVSENPNIFIHARQLRMDLPDDEDDADPLDLTNVQWLKPTMVRIDHLLVSSNEEPPVSWGSWSFSISPNQDGIEINKLTGQGQNWSLQSDLPMWWDRATNRTSFATAISGDDLGDLMALRGYEPSIESQSFVVNANVGWPGSPLAVDVDHLSGSLSAEMQSGRLLNVDQGEDVLRFVSLLNFSKLVNRLTLDFRDVIEKGMHFDSVALNSAWDNGQFTIAEPLKINGPGIDISFSGLGNTRSGEINGDLKVTVQLHKGFHAAAAYLASTNPPAVIGWLLGSAIMSNPIKRLSTANYQLTGTLADPQFTRMNPDESQSNRRISAQRSDE